MIVGDAVTDAPVVALKLAPGAQVYVFAPLAVSTCVDPEQIVADAGEILTVGTGLTVTKTVWVSVHPPEVPVTVYVVVTVVVEITEAPVVALKAVAGAQVYVVAPEAVRVVEDPEQIVGADADAVTVGTGFTVTKTVWVSVQPLAFVPVTV